MLLVARFFLIAGLVRDRLPASAARGTGQYGV